MSYLGHPIQILFFLYWPDCLKFSHHLPQCSSIPFLTTPLIIIISLNPLTISCPHRKGNLPRGHFWFLGYHSTNAWVQLLFLAQRNFCSRYSTIASFTPLLNYLSLRIMYICNNNLNSPTDMKIFTLSG